MCAEGDKALPLACPRPLCRPGRDVRETGDGRDEFGIHPHSEKHLEMKKKKSVEETNNTLIAPITFSRFY